MVQSPGGEKAPEEEPETKETQGQELDAMTKKQLLEYAAKNGVDGVKQSMSKAEMLDIIIKA